MSETLRLTPEEIRRYDAETEAKAAETPDRLKPGAASQGETAVAGRNGHLFIGLGSNRWEHHYAGRVNIDPVWFDAWRRVLDGRQEEAQRRGVRLCNFVVPEKQVVLPQERWEEPPNPDGRPFWQLLQRLGPEAKVCYPARELVEAKRRGPVYFLRNSHWCPSGCLTGVRALLDTIGVSADLEALRFAYRREFSSHDLPPHFFERPQPVEAGFLKAAGEYTFEHHPLHTVGRLVGSRYGIANPAAPDPRRVVLFGDSFSYDAGLAFALSAVFRQVSFYWSKHVVWQTVDEVGADLVVWESAERFMVTLPRT